MLKVMQILPKPNTESKPKVKNNFSKDCLKVHSYFASKMRKSSENLKVKKDTIMDTNSYNSTKHLSPRSIRLTTTKPQMEKIEKVDSEQQQPYPKILIQQIDTINTKTSMDTLSSEKENGGPNNDDGNNTNTNSPTGLQKKLSKLKICHKKSSSQNLKLHNPLSKLKKKTSLSKIHISKSSHNFSMTPLFKLKSNKSVKKSKETVKSNQSTIPNGLKTKNISISSRLSMNSSPGGYVSDNFSTHSEISQSNSSNYSFMPNFKGEQKLKRKDFSESIKCLGTGATGSIQLVYRKDDKDKYYAIKEFIMPNQKGTQKSDREFFKHLQTEYTIGTLLHHRNVVEVENFIYSDYYKRNIKQRHVYQVMEYCNGGDLFDIIQKGCMSQGDILCFFRQLMEGLNYIHSMGVAHRDLKPENILFKGNRDLKILDFGAAIMFKSPYSDEIIKCSGIVGSEPYMAPEQFSLKQYDPRTVDIWSCGIIFLAMFYNELPWKRAIQANVKYNLWATKGKSELINDLPNGPRQLITRMLEPDDTKRITMKEIFEDPWFKQINTCATYDGSDISCFPSYIGRISSQLSTTSRHSHTSSSSKGSLRSYSRSRSRSQSKSQRRSFLSHHCKNPSSSVKTVGGDDSSHNSLSSNEEVHRTTTNTTAAAATTTTTTTTTTTNATSVAASDHRLSSEEMKKNPVYDSNSCGGSTTTTEACDTTLDNDSLLQSTESRRSSGGSMNKSEEEGGKEEMTNEKTLTFEIHSHGHSSGVLPNVNNTTRARSSSHPPQPPKKASFIISSSDEEDEDDGDDEEEEDVIKEKKTTSTSTSTKELTEKEKYWGLDLKCTHSYEIENHIGR